MKANNRQMHETGSQDDPAHPRPGCPRCGGTRSKPIVYGFVDAGAYLELGRATPDFELGGLTPRAENRCCVQCGHRWAANNPGPENTDC